MYIYIQYAKTDSNICKYEKGEFYYQVAWTLMGEGDNPEGKSILERELNPLERIHDHNLKYLLTMAFAPLTSHNGIRQMNALE